jgi:sigma-E factor negative regulatory protein RseC
MLATLISAVKATDNEGFSGLLAIAVLLPYYVVLYLLRRKLQSVFEFKIETI